MREMWIMKLQTDSDYAEWVARHEDVLRATANRAAAGGVGWLRMNGDGDVEIVDVEAKREAM